MGRAALNYAKGVDKRSGWTVLEHVAYCSGGKRPFLSRPRLNLAS